MVYKGTETVLDCCQKWNSFSKEEWQHPAHNDSIRGRSYYCQHCGQLGSPILSTVHHIHRDYSDISKHEQQPEPEQSEQHQH